MDLQLFILWFQNGGQQPYFNGLFLDFFVAIKTEKQESLPINISEIKLCTMFIDKKPFVHKTFDTDYLMKLYY